MNNRIEAIMADYESAYRNASGCKDPTAGAAMRRLLHGAVYGDGRPIERGDVVYIPGESALKTYRVIGYDAKRRMACIADMDGVHVHEVPPSALSRW